MYSDILVGDADSGYVMFKPSFQVGDNSVVIILGTKTGGVEVIDNGFYINDAQLLYVESK